MKRKYKHMKLKKENKKAPLYQKKGWSSEEGN
jgi:hypothetical protein